MSQQCLSLPAIFRCHHISQRGCFCFYLFHSSLHRLLCCHELPLSWTSLALIALCHLGLQKNSLWWLPVQLQIPILVHAFSSTFWQHYSQHTGGWSILQHILVQVCVAGTSQPFHSPVFCKWKMWHEVRSAPINVDVIDICAVVVPMHVSILKK